MKKIKHPNKIKLYFYIFLGLFVAISSVVVITQAASKTGYDRFKNIAVLKLSYYDEKPTTVSKVAGVMNYQSRAHTIDITIDDILYCTPENNGTITSRQLSSDEQKQIAQIITEARSVPSEETSNPNKTNQIQVNDNKGLYIRDGASIKTTSIYMPDQKSDFFSTTINILESLCSVPSNPIPEDKQPKWLDSNQSVSYKPQSITDKIKTMFFPSAKAGGSGTLYGLDTTAENQQHLMMAQARKSAKLPATTRQDCLDQAARIWAAKMAADKWMRHSSPISALPEQYCGKEWAKLGENVGTQAGLVVSSSASVSTSASANIFNAYMRSPGHRANILDPAFTHHGIGAYKTTDGKQIFMAQIFWKPSVVK